MKLSCQIGLKCLSLHRNQSQWESLDQIFSLCTVELWSYRNQAYLSPWHRNSFVLLLFLCCTILLYARKHEQSSIFHVCIILESFDLILIRQALISWTGLFQIHFDVLFRFLLCVMCANCEILDVAVVPEATEPFPGWVWLFRDLQCWVNAFKALPWCHYTTHLYWWAPVFLHIKNLLVDEFKVIN